VRVPLALAVLLASAPNAAAQNVSVRFQDGLVSLTARNVTVPRILDEWARVGGVRIINGERVPGAPVTLELVDVPESQALEVLLRSAAGYVVGARETGAPGAARFDRVRILPTSRAPTASSFPAPRPAPAEAGPVPIDEPNADGAPDDASVPPGTPLSRLPRAFQGTEPPLPSPDDGPQPEEATEPEPGGVQVMPGNPFGVVPGSGRPGVISPVARPRSTPAQGQ
jgi:hypothetical protein